MSLLLIVDHRYVGDDDSNPIEVIREDGSIGGGVFPVEKGIEDALAAVSVEFGVARVWYE
jgi:hypothetical protein